jgi:hypothetical protein
MASRLPRADQAQEVTTGRLAYCLFASQARVIGLEQTGYAGIWHMAEEKVEMGYRGNRPGEFHLSVPRC